MPSITLDTNVLLIRDQDLESIAKQMKDKPFDLGYVSITNKEVRKAEDYKYNEKRLLHAQQIISRASGLLLRRISETGVWGEGELGYMVWAGDDRQFEEILVVISAGSFPQRIS